MAHDFAKQRASRNGRSAGNAAAPWAWLFSGIAIGSAFSFLVYLAMLKPPVPASPPGQAGEHATTAQSRTEPKPEPQRKPDPEPATAARPQFDFYDILRDNNAAPTTPAGESSETSGNAAQPVEVPEPAVTAPVASAPPAATPPPAGATATAAPTSAPGATPAAATPETARATALALQAGAFSRAADADRRRGELLLLGYDAKVETVRLPDGQTRYRVQVGPFADPQAQSNARRALRDVGIETL